jgi:glycosyltransferase involved in cell wall biosynthesis
MGAMTTPLVSIVTGVYNGGRYLQASLQSVLDQEGVDFEFVVIDDGSTDDTPQVLAELQRRDARLTVLRQENQGLTRALIRGCQEARGALIARHDADDLSLPGRLQRQAAWLEKESRLAMVSCWTRTIGPEDELLFETSRPTDFDECTRLLTEDGMGMYHGSVMFRAADYHRVGGYRPPFRFTQDWDLWLRLADVGSVGFVPEPLYAFRVSSGSITAHRRGQQARLHELARRCRAARRDGQAEASLLEEVEAVCAEPLLPKNRSLATSDYFIGKCLLNRRDRSALKYLRRCVRLAPWNVRYWAAFAGGALLCR